MGVFRSSALLTGLICTLICDSVVASSSLSLSEAEQLAISCAPELERLKATEKALEQQAIADGQLPDPKLMVGADNVPTNTFSFAQDDMTMISTGLQQAFPPGETLEIKSRQTQTLALAEKRKYQEQTLKLLRNVREAWLNLYYLTHAVKIIQENKHLYEQLLKVVKSQYEVGIGSQSDLVQVQLELSRLEDQVIQLQQQADTARVQLGRWIGPEEVKRSLTSSLPYWPNPPPLETLTTCLHNHPLLKIDAANIDAAHDEVTLAHEQYKPGWMVDVAYGVRQGNFSCCGGKRTDMIGARVSMDLPVFTENRQDRRAQAGVEQLTATKLDQQIHYRDLNQELSTQYANWQRLEQRAVIYQNQLVPEVGQGSKAALLAYQSATTDLTAVLRAISSHLIVKLEQLQIKVDASKARAALLYMEGIAQ